MAKIKYYFLNIFYIVLWILGIFVFLFLAEKSNTVVYPQSKIFYWSSIAILISAFLASTSAILSIENSKNLALKEKEASQEKAIVHLQYLLTSLTLELFYLKSEYEIDDEEQHSNKLKSSFEIEMAQERKKNILNKIEKIETSDLLYNINTEIRENIIKVSLSVSQLSQLINAYIHNNKISDNSAHGIIHITKEILKVLDGIQHQITITYPKYNTFRESLKYKDIQKRMNGLST